MDFSLDEHRSEYCFEGCTKCHAVGEQSPPREAECDTWLDSELTRYSRPVLLQEGENFSENDGVFSKSTTLIPSPADCQDTFRDSTPVPCRWASQNNSPSEVSGTSAVDGQHGSGPHSERTSVGPAVDKELIHFPEKSDSRTDNPTPKSLIETRTRYSDGRRKCEVTGTESASSQATTSVSTTRALSHIGMLGQSGTLIGNAKKGFDQTGSETTVKQKNKHCCHRNSFCKRHPYRVLILIFLSTALLLMLAFVAFLLVSPYVIQREMDKSRVELQSAVVTHPSETQFDLTFTSRVERQSAIPVTIKPFHGRVLYAPQDLPDWALQTRRLLLSETIRETELVELFDRDFPSETYFLIPETLNSTVKHSSFASRSPRTARRLQTKSSVTSEWFELGTMEMPAMHLTSRNVMTTSSSTLVITDAALFKTFLRELVMRGTTRWTLLGTPSVSIAGFVFQNITFQKELLLHGPKLTPAMRVTKTADNNPWWATIPPVNPTQKQENDDVDVLQITSVDLTLSTPASARLHTVAVFTNANGTTVVDPLGRLSFIASYANQRFVRLVTAESVALQPGENVFDLYGTIEPVDRESDPQRQKAISALFSKIVTGETPVLETRGVGSSIALFAPAIQAIDVKTAMGGLFKQHDASTTAASAPSMVRSMEIATLELTEPASLPTKGMGMKGKVNVVLGNPFGRDTGLLIKKAYLTGMMAVVLNTTATTMEDVAARLLESGAVENYDNDGPLHENGKDGIATLKIGSLTGILAGTVQSSVVYNDDGFDETAKMGALPVSVQQTELSMDLLLDFTGVEESFRTFIRYCLSNDFITVQLLNMTGFIELSTPMGILELEKVPLSRDLHLRGFAKMKGLGIESIRMQGNNPSAHIGELGNILKEGIRLDITTKMPPSAQITLYLGALALDITYRGKHLMYLTAEHCKVSPEQATQLYFTGVAVLGELDIGTTLSILAKLRARTLKSLQGTFVPVGSVDQMLHDDSPLWLREALYGFTIEIPINKNNNNNNSGSDVEQDTTTAPRPFRDIILPRLSQVFQNANNMPSDTNLYRTTAPESALSTAPLRNFPSRTFLSHLMDGFQRRNHNFQL